MMWRSRRKVGIGAEQLGSPLLYGGLHSLVVTLTEVGRKKGKKKERKKARERERERDIYIYMATDPKFAYKNALQNHLPPRVLNKKRPKKWRRKTAPFLHLFGPLILLCSSVMTIYHQYFCSSFACSALKCCFSLVLEHFYEKCLKQGTC